MTLGGDELLVDQYMRQRPVCRKRIVRRSRDSKFVFRDIFQDVPDQESLGLAVCAIFIAVFAVLSCLQSTECICLVALFSKFIDGGEDAELGYGGHEPV
jgi:hypothetical protein